MATFNDKVIVDMEIMTAKGIQGLKNLGAQLSIIDGKMTKMASRSFTSITDAVNDAFPSTLPSGVGNLQNAVQDVTDNMGEIAGKDFDLGEFGIEKIGGKNANQALSAQALIEQSTNEAARATATMEQNMGRFAKNTENSSRLMQILNDDAKSIGVLMALLFGGMTIQRWGMSMLRFVLPAMDKLENHTSKGTKSVNAMKASFEFLKFSMFEAFTSTGLFQNFVELLIKASNSLSTMVTKYPILTQIVGVLGAGLAASGWVMQIAGGFFQFGMLWRILANTSSPAKTMGHLTDAKNKLNGVSSALSGIQKVIGVGLIVKAGLDAFDLLTDDELSTTEFYEGLAKVAFFTGLGALSLGAGVYSIPIAAIVTLSIAGFKILKDLPEKITKAEFGISDKEWEEIMAIGPDSNLQQAFNKGFQGTVVPSYVEQSWGEFGTKINETVMSGKTAITENLVNGAMVTLDQSFIDVGITQQTEIIDRWENWSPSSKTLRINVEKSGDDSGPFNFGSRSRTFTGSSTGD